MITKLVTVSSLAAAQYGKVNLNERKGESGLSTTFKLQYPE